MPVRAAHSNTSQYTCSDENCTDDLSGCCVDDRARSRSTAVAGSVIPTVDSVKHFGELVVCGPPADPVGGLVEEGIDEGGKDVSVVVV